MPLKRWSALHNANVTNLFCSKIPVHDNDVENGEEQARICGYLYKNACQARKQEKEVEGVKSPHKIYTASFEALKPEKIYEIKDVNKDIVDDTQIIDDADKINAPIIDPLAPRKAHGSIVTDSALRFNISMGFNVSMGIIGIMGIDVGVGFDSLEEAKFLIYINNIYMPDIATGRYRHAAHAPPPDRKARAPGKEKK